MYDKSLPAFLRNSVYLQSICCTPCASVLRSSANLYLPVGVAFLEHLFYFALLAPHTICGIFLPTYCSSYMHLIVSSLFDFQTSYELRVTGMLALSLSTNTPILNFYDILQL